MYVCIYNLSVSKDSILEGSTSSDLVNFEPKTSGGDARYEEVKEESGELAGLGYKASSKPVWARVRLGEGHGLKLY